MFWIRFCPLLAALLALCLLGGQACSPPAACKNDKISDVTLNPTGSKCSKSCECNNQAFRGACVDGTCVAFARESCKSKGAERICRIEESLGGTCREGIQICRPDYLNADRWGDCEANCQACTPGDAQTCYNGPAGTLNEGICLAGIRKCTAKGNWGICDGQKLPQPEKCDGKDDDCNGQIDDNCTTPTEKVPENPTEKAPHETTEDTGKEQPQEAPGEQPTEKPADMAPDAGSQQDDTRDAPPERPVDRSVEPTSERPEGSAERRENPHEGTPEVNDAGPREFPNDPADGGMREALTEVPAPTETPDSTVQEASPDAPSDTRPEVPPTEQTPEGCIAGQIRACRVVGKQGECVAGTQQCSNGAWQPCQSNKSANPTELCDGKDDDCDGTTDEGCKCITGQTQKCGGIGACAGTQTCDQSGQWGTCQGISSPQTETCNGKDDDCDGSIDENVPQCVTTHAGGADPYYLDGSAKDARLGRPWGLVFDAAGNIFVADSAGHRIRKIDKAGNVTTFAGDGTAGHKDGMGTNAKFHSPAGLAFDVNNNLYVADSNNHRIRKIDTSGNVTTFAGDGTAGHKDDLGINAKFNNPYGLILDTSGNLYVADYSNHRIRKIDTSGNVTTFAGDGTAGHKDDLGINAKFNNPYGLILDTSGNLYVADYSNHRIRKIDKSGNVTTFAGDGTAGYKDGMGTNAQFYSPWGLAFDVNGNLYVTDNYRIRKIDKSGNVTTLAGSIAGYADGQGPRAQFNRPYSVAIDTTGKLYIADTYNNSIREIDTIGNVTTFVGHLYGYQDGKGAEVQFNNPQGLALDTSGNLYITDTYNHCIRKIDTAGNVTTIAGAFAGYKDGKGTNAKFNNPHGLVLDTSGNLYVADYSNHRIRKIDKSGNVTTLAGSVTGYADGVGKNAKFNSPHGLALDASGNLYVADIGNHRIRKIDTSGNVTTFAGDGTPGYADGQDTSAQFKYPRILAFDANGNLYVADSGNYRIRKIDTSGKVTTIAGSGAGYADGLGANARFNSPRGLALDASGNLYVSDRSSYRIRKITLVTNGTCDTQSGYSGYCVTTIAGNGTRGFTNGLGTNTQFNNPHGLVFDGVGNLYIADTGNHCIRKISP